MQSRPQVARAILVHSGKILLLVRADHEETRPGDYDLPGGGIESSDHSIVDGVVREIFEETGLLIATDGLTEMFVPGIDAHNPAFERHVFLGVASSTDVRINIDEHKSYQWLLIAEAIKVFQHPSYSPALTYLADRQQI